MSVPATKWEDVYATQTARITELERENAVLRSLLREAIQEHVDPYNLPEGDAYIARVKTALGEAKP